MLHAHHPIEAEQVNKQVHGLQLQPTDNLNHLVTPK